MTDEKKEYSNDSTRVNATYFIPYIREMCNSQVSRFDMDSILLLCKVLYTYRTGGKLMFCNEITRKDEDIHIKNLHYDYTYKLLDCDITEKDVMRSACCLYNINRDVFMKLVESYNEFCVSAEVLNDRLSTLYIDYKKIEVLTYE